MNVLSGGSSGGVPTATAIQVSAATDDATAPKNIVVWKNLVRWVEENHGGEIHPALHLEGGDDDDRGSTAGGNVTVVAKPRGVVATRAISKGEWLIRLPSTAIISGASIIIGDESSAVMPSSWLKCVAAFYRASQSSKEDWQPYLLSLPAVDEYETLFHWTDDEVKRFLAGTTIGTMVQDDRKEGSMIKRYELAVRPFLRKLGLVVAPSKTSQKDYKNSFDAIKDDDATSIEDIVTKEEFDNFLQACMCISTRGFHLTALEERAAGTDEAGLSDSDQGPFLLPIIDLLNHNPVRKCTTLQREETTGIFCMKAERDVAAGEEVFHSYGDTLTAAQVLHTFGFVPSQSSSTIEARSLTPVILNKTKHILAACEHVKTSSIPTEIQAWMTARSLINDDGEVWDVDTIPTRPLNDTDAPEDWLVSTDNLPTGILTDELITFVVLQFLPQEACDEIIGIDHRISAWLDRSILEDIYLGKLVCHAVFEAIERRKMEYKVLDVLPGWELSGACPLERDKDLLKELSRIPSPDVSEMRAMYALRVRIEELSSLEALAKEVTTLCDRLTEKESIELAFLPLSKRPKLE